VEVIPNYPKDQQDFTYARLAILRKDWVNPKTKTVDLPKDMPREILWIEPNKTKVKWEINQIQRDKEALGSVDRLKDFGKPVLPTGWQFKSDPNAAAPAPNNTRQPTVIRPQQGK
jgi:hypothetical protein